MKTLLSRKQVPKGWQYFTVRAITHHSEAASGYDGKVATEMIGAKTGEECDRLGWNVLLDHVAKTTARPEFALLPLICAGYEKTIQKDSWRSAGQAHNAPPGLVVPEDSSTEVPADRPAYGTAHSQRLRRFG